MEIFPISIKTLEFILEFPGTVGTYRIVTKTRKSGKSRKFIGNLSEFPTFPTFPILEIKEKSTNLHRIWEFEPRQENTNFSITTITEGKRRSGPHRWTPKVLRFSLSRNIIGFFSRKTRSTLEIFEQFWRHKIGPGRCKGQILYLFLRIWNFRYHHSRVRYLKKQLLFFIVF